MGKKKKSKDSMPDYKKPPVIEVACGLKFNRLKGFKIPYFGLFWDKVRKDFPICEHAATLGVPDRLEEPSFEFPLPRLWLINENKNFLLQLQDNMFFYNWRRIKPDDPYPRYKKLMEAFKTNFKMFSDFVEDERLGSIEPLDCELTYINDIVKGEGWETISHIHQIIPELKWRSDKSRFLPEPLNIGWKAIFSLPEDKGRFIIKLDQVTRRIDKQSMLRLEVSAKGLGVDKSFSAVWDWFEVAHQWIVEGFTDVTNEETQKSIWERIK